MRTPDDVREPYLRPSTGNWDIITPLYWIEFDYRGGGNGDYQKINFISAYIFPTCSRSSLWRDHFFEYDRIPLCLGTFLGTLRCRLTLTRVADASGQMLLPSSGRHLKSRWTDFMYGSDAWFLVLVDICRFHTGKRLVIFWFLVHPRSLILIFSLELSFFSSLVYWMLGLWTVALILMILNLCSGGGDFVWLLFYLLASACIADIAGAEKARNSDDD